MKNKPKQNDNTWTRGKFYLIFFVAFYAAFMMSAFPGKDKAILFLLDSWYHLV